MFVSESSVFHPRCIKVRICSITGADVVLDVGLQISVDELKVLAVGSFGEPAESVKQSVYNKLVLVRSSKVLDEQKTLSQEGIIENDEILIVKKRIPATQLDVKSTKREDRKGPSLDTIKAATENIPATNTDVRPEDGVANIDFQAELRKILVSLIEVAQCILCFNPEAANIFKEAEEYLEEKSSGSKEMPELVKGLVDMGFPEDHAVKALLLNRMSSSEAVQWLVEHENDPDIDVPLPESVMGEYKHSVEVEKNTAKQSTSCLENNNNQTKLSGPEKVAKMLKSFKAFRRNQFRPNPRALHNLMEMGFQEANVIDALRATGNKEDDACEWLLNRANHKTDDTGIEEGLDQESHLYKAILANPVVQLGLNNPRSLIAFLHMLENPSNTQQWLNDPDTGPMLIQISRIYHAEKHAPSEPSTSSKYASAASSSSTLQSMHSASSVVTPSTGRQDNENTRESNKD